MVVPEHLGLVMDGNGRWATARGLERTKGHVEGLKTARLVTRAASDAGVNTCRSMCSAPRIGSGRPKKSVS